MAKQPKALKMLTHGQVWGALDRLAERAGLSPSGLARRAGLDPTTFNKSKRITPDGRERWPSTESLAKALAATGSSIDTFVQLIGDHGRDVQSVPLPALSEALRRGDRVVVETVAGEVLIGELKRRTAKALELAPLGADGQERTLASDDVAWIARIVWTRQ
jgi:phage repressor protein C with HTH and peptisase S24 domain